jgi:hypothetical protein
MQFAIAKYVKSNGVISDRRERAAFFAFDAVGRPVYGDERDAVFSSTSTVRPPSCSVAAIFSATSCVEPDRVA